MGIVLDLFVRGEPVGQPRQRFRAVPTRDAKGKPIFKHGRMIYIAQAYHDEEVNRDCDIWKSKIRAAVRSKMAMADPIDVPVKVDLFFYMPPPQYLKTAKAPTGVIPFNQKPDVDNLAKAALDALTTVWVIGEKTVGVWQDDKLATDLYTRKEYHAMGNTTGVWITIETLAEPDAPLFKEKETPVHPATLLRRQQMAAGP